MKLTINRLGEYAIIPTYGSEYAAGLDLYSPIETVILPQTRSLIKLDISIELPVQTFGHILPRSGLALKNGIHVGAGVIDQDYRGNVGVLLFNLGSEPFTIKKGDRIAQLVVYALIEPEICLVEQKDETVRGDKGFGSSGR
jgi:dUTP pyrophosphatase